MNEQAGTSIYQPVCLSACILLEHQTDQFSYLSFIPGEGRLGFFILTVVVQIINEHHQWEVDHVCEYKLLQL